MNVLPLQNSAAMPAASSSPRPMSTESARADQQRVATQFEGLFVSLLLKELRESLDEGIFGGEHSDTYGAIFDQFLGEYLAEQGGLGIRHRVMTQLSTSKESGSQP